MSFIPISLLVLQPKRNATFHVSVPPTGICVYSASFSASNKILKFARHHIVFNKNKFIEQRGEQKIAYEAIMDGWRDEIEISEY